MEQGTAPKWFDFTKGDVMIADIPLQQLPERITIDLNSPAQEEEEKKDGSEEGWKRMDSLSRSHDEMVSNNGVVGIPRLLNKQALTKPCPFKLQTDGRDETFLTSSFYNSSTTSMMSMEEEGDDDEESEEEEDVLSEWLMKRNADKGEAKQAPTAKPATKPSKPSLRTEFRVRDKTPSHNSTKSERKKLSASSPSYPTPSSSQKSLISSASQTRTKKEKQRRQMNNSRTTQLPPSTPQTRPQQSQQQPTTASRPCPRSLTNPQTPKLRTKARGEIKSQPQPQQPPPPQQQPTERRLTIPRPPVLRTSVRGAGYEQVLNEKIQKERESEVSAPFRAGPIRRYTTKIDDEEKTQPLPLTVPCSPKLRSKTRGAQHQRALEDKIEKEQHNHNQQLQDRQQQRKRKLENISRPENSAILTPRNPNLHQQHSKPKQKQYQQQGLTTPSPFSFQTDRRASIREDTEPQRKQRKLQQQGEEERHQTEKEKAERREIRRMRREMVHKACPITYDQKTHPIIRKTARNIPLTLPKSPKFATDSRVRRRGAGDYSSIFE